MLKSTAARLATMGSDASKKREIVIVGGGIIGCTTAYFLTRHPSFDPTHHSISIIEATAIASGASGKAGGLLALWAYPEPLVSMSYRLHAELAKEHGGEKRWGYREVFCGTITAKGKVNDIKDDGPVDIKGSSWQKLPKTGKGGTVKADAPRGTLKAGIPKDLDWFEEDCVNSYSEMSTPNTTAQVHPYLFTTSIAELAAQAGAKIIFGKVASIDQAGGTVRGVTYEDKETKQVHTIPATDVVVSAGPWSSQVYPKAPIEALRAHSVVIKADVTPYAVFTDIELPKGFGRKGGGDVKVRRHSKSVNPEMYARPDGTVYACGEGDSLIPLPTTADLVVCDQERCQDIADYIGSISKEMREGEILAKQACYLPLVSSGGGPLIGPTNVKGMLLAAGHTCWGIQNSCATGKLVSELIFDGKAVSANIDALDPRKVM